jgi:putative acetyltransferase
LVRAGLAKLKESSCPFVIVLGHPEYYPRFGFVPASRHGIKCQWEGVPEAAFMLLILDESAMNGVSGVASCRSEFNEAI